MQKPFWEYDTNVTNIMELETCLKLFVHQYKWNIPVLTLGAGDVTTEVSGGVGQQQEGRLETVIRRNMNQSCSF